MKPIACNNFAVAMSRRKLLGAGTGMVPWLLSSSALAQTALGKPGEVDKTLVVLFLRGGADGLNMLVPYQEDEYYRNRPSTAIKPEKLIKLGDTFGLNPNLRLFEKWFKSGDLSLVHAVGSEDKTRSHFEAMSAMERGAAAGNSGESSGWLARYLDAAEGAYDNPLSAITYSDTVPDSLRGGPIPVITHSMQGYKLDADEDFVRFLAKEYGKGQDSVRNSGKSVLAALEKVAILALDKYRPEGDANYAADPLGIGLRETASLIKAEVGVKVVCLETTGWDTHVAQGAEDGWLAMLLKGISQNMDAFWTDVGTMRDRVQVVIMTEFGRRLSENQGLGTDHGTASVMMAFGAKHGGSIWGEWPGLGPKQVDEAGDLRPVNDYRKVLTELLAPTHPQIANVW
jgi:uncharacterized protein (DUF1501 family)